MLDWEIRHAQEGSRRKIDRRKRAANHGLLHIGVLSRTFKDDNLKYTQDKQALCQTIAVALKL